MTRIEYLTRHGAAYCPGCAIDCARASDLDVNNPDHFGAAFSTDEQPVAGVTCDECGDEIVPPVVLHVSRDTWADNPRDCYRPEAVLFIPAGNRYLSGDRGAIDAEEGALFAAPIYGYVHGVVRVSLSPFTCPWDSGRIGTLWVPASSGMTVEAAAEIARREFAEWAQYVHGDVFEVVAKRGDDVLDSCGNLYAESPEEAARAFLDTYGPTEKTSRLGLRNLWEDCDVVVEGR